MSSEDSDVQTITSPGSYLSCVREVRRDGYPWFRYVGYESYRHHVEVQDVPPTSPPGVWNLPARTNYRCTGDCSRRNKCALAISNDNQKWMRGPRGERLEKITEPGVNTAIYRYNANWSLRKLKKNLRPPPRNVVRECLSDFKSFAAALWRAYKLDQENAREWEKAAQEVKRAAEDEKKKRGAEELSIMTTASGECKDCVEKDFNLPSMEGISDEKAEHSLQAAVERAGSRQE